VHNPVTEIDQRDAGCPAPGHVESQSMSDAAGGSGDHRDLPFNRVPIFAFALFFCDCVKIF
jgi:hypothetical protein